MTIVASLRSPYRKEDLKLILINKAQNPRFGKHSLGEKKWIDAKTYVAQNLSRVVLTDNTKIQEIRNVTLNGELSKTITDFLDTYTKSNPGIQSFDARFSYDGTYSKRGRYRYVRVELVSKNLGEAIIARDLNPKVVVILKAEHEPLGSPKQNSYKRGEIAPIRFRTCGNCQGTGRTGRRTGWRVATDNDLKRDYHSIRPNWGNGQLLLPAAHDAQIVPIYAVCDQCLAQDSTRIHTLLANGQFGSISNNNAHW